MALLTIVMTLKLNGRGLSPLDTFKITALLVNHSANHWWSAKELLVSIWWTTQMSLPDFNQLTKTPEVPGQQGGKNTARLRKTVNYYQSGNWRSKVLLAYREAHSCSRVTNEPTDKIGCPHPPQINRRWKADQWILTQPIRKERCSDIATFRLK